jgi:hypothetical protein
MHFRQRGVVSRVRPRRTGIQPFAPCLKVARQVCGIFGKTGSEVVLSARVECQVVKFHLLVLEKFDKLLDAQHDCAFGSQTLIGLKRIAFSQSIPDVHLHVSVAFVNVVAPILQKDSMLL